MSVYLLNILNNVGAHAHTNNYIQLHFTVKFFLIILIKIRLDNESMSIKPMNQPN